MFLKNAVKNVLCIDTMSKRITQKLGDKCKPEEPLQHLIFTYQITGNKFIAWKTHDCRDNKTWRC